MKNIDFFEFYNVIIVRYSGEIWLKSQKVKMKMLKILMNNIKNMLTCSEISFYKYQLSSDSARIFYFFNNKDVEQAIEILQKAFGVYSLSPALRTSNKMKNIIERTIEVGKKIMQTNDTFALRVKRSGTHEYSSQDVAIKVGQAIKDYFVDLNLKVNLSSPKKVIYIEIRDEFAYIFTNIVLNMWEGLPLERQYKILVMDIGRLNDLLAGFLLMRRGAEIYPVLFNLTKNNDFLKTRLSNWKEIVQYTPFFKFTVRQVDLTKILDFVSQELTDKKYICAICRLVRFEILSNIQKEFSVEGFPKIGAITDGVSLNRSAPCHDTVDLESIALSYLFSECPIFTPLVGFSSKKIESLLFKIAPTLNNYDYCQYKPKNQEFNANELKKLYKSLNLRDFISGSLRDMEDINII